MFSSKRVNKLEYYNDKKYIETTIVIRSELKDDNGLSDYLLFNTIQEGNALMEEVNNKTEELISETFDADIKMLKSRVVNLYTASNKKRLRRK